MKLKSLNWVSVHVNESEVSEPTGTGDLHCREEVDDQMKQK